ncbi:MAG: SpoIIE family protein phosphatase [Bryobacterales bacterium]|nr:SpoIIE family protein phosphatase [Bryobacterales bacterium]
MANSPPPLPKLRWFDKAYLAVTGAYFLLSFVVETGFLGAMAGFFLVIVGFMIGLRYLRVVGKQLLWPLRNRLRVTYMFIGVVPILLILLLVAVGSYILTGQIASFLLTTELQRRAALLAGPGELLASTPPSERESAIQRMFPYFEQQFPGMHLCAVADKRTWVYPENAPCPQPPSGWERANGLVSRNNMLNLWVHTRPNDTEVTIVMPLTRAFLNQLVPGLVDVVLMGRIDRIAGGNSLQDGALFFDFARAPGQGERLGQQAEPLPKANLFDFNVLWQTNLSVAEWERPGSNGAAFLTFHSRPSAVLDVLSRPGMADGGAVDLAQSASIAFVSICVLFLIVEAFSALAGMRLSRTITAAVENLYEGTRQVMRGDFQHRVKVHGEDQLSDLGRSFNLMSENLETLVAVSKEKERMQSELEIAREVQAGLYPKDPPRFEYIELIAVSQPARMASGDYFDYLRLYDDRVLFAIGDVAGKGISAALLMASIQSTIRAQLRPYLPPARGANDTWSAPQEELSTATLVSRLNQQIHQFTSASKYATFFCGCFDDRTGELRYTNGGHLPPLLIRGGEVRTLNVDGLVVGAFAFASYDESRLMLEPGDLLVLYTDGISEPENEYGEEFGEDRLRALLLANAHKDTRELADLVVATVQEWVGKAEQFDDITLLLVKKL